MQIRHSWRPPTDDSTFEREHVCAVAIVSNLLSGHRQGLFGTVRISSAPGRRLLPNRQVANSCLLNALALAPAPRVMSTAVGMRREEVYNFYDGRLSSSLLNAGDSLPSAEPNS